MREYQGTLVFSQFDPAGAGSTGSTIRRAGADRAPSSLPIAAADRPFDADIGPDSNGRPQLIYTRCDETCDLFVYSLSEAPTGERAGAQRQRPRPPRRRADAVARAGSRGRGSTASSATARSSSTRRRSPRRARGRRPGCPACPSAAAATSRARGATTGRAVDASSCGATTSRQIVGYECRRLRRAQPDRAAPRPRRPTAAPRQIAFQVDGLSGQAFAGPSFANGWLGWYRTCLGDPARVRRRRAARGATTSGSRRCAKGARGPIRVHGFADTMAYHYRVESCSPETQGDFNASCRIEQVPAPDYEPTAPPTR